MCDVSTMSKRTGTFESTTTNKRACTFESNDTIQIGQFLTIVNNPGCVLIESLAFITAERKTQVKVPCQKTLEYFCTHGSWGIVTQMLVDGVCTLNVCNVHHVENKRVYYQLRIHRRNLSEYKGVSPVVRRKRIKVADDEYDSDEASVSVSQTDSEDGEDGDFGDNDFTESDSEFESESEFGT